MAKHANRLALVLVPILALCAGGCGDDATPTAPTTPRTSPVTETFASNVTVQGGVWRIVSAEQAGAFSATLTSTDQPAVAIGLAIGLRSGSNSCLVTHDLVAEAGSAPQLSTQVDAGDYCVKVFDAGQLRTPMSFSVTITYP